MNEHNDCDGPEMHSVCRRRVDRELAALRARLAEAQRLLVDLLAERTGAAQLSNACLAAREWLGRADNEGERHGG